MEALMLEEGPISAPITSQAHQLLTSGLVSVARMARAFRLLQDMPFATNMVE
jgi:hypothetical protein